MKSIFCFFCGCAALLLHEASFGQGSNSNYLNNYVQPAPTAASLGKYADIPVSFYTGTPQIEIPVYNLSDGAIKIPISISYHASGIRVSENASWVGLGWALNAGGMITRTVKGAPDEGASKINGYPGAVPKGYYYSHGLSQMPLLPYPAENVTTYQYFAQLFIPDVLNGAVDCEPDLYTFNFNGYVGKFVFDENQQVRLLTDADIKINVVASGATFLYWVITTPDGVQYYFGEDNVHELTYPHSTRTGEDSDGKAPSSWYLTRIYNPNTKETATLSYTPEYYEYRDIGPETTLYGTAVGGLNDIENSCDLSNINLIPDIITTTVYGYRLASIQTKNYTVSFVANSQRQDLLPSLNYLIPGVTMPPGSTSAHALDTIKIYSGAICIKKFALGLNYFTSPTNSTSSGVITALSNYSNDVTDTKRLKLNSVTEYNGNGTSHQPPYSFVYNEAQTLPRRLSFDQDHWGFSNTATGNVNSFLTPTVKGQFCVVISNGANRSPSWPQMSAFTLTGIQYPLGGTSNFQFEANNPTSNSDPASMMGGLRIHQIQTTDNVTGQFRVKKYDYLAGGFEYRLPDDYYLIALHNEYYHTGNIPNNTGGFDGYSNAMKSPTNQLRSSQSIVPLQDPQGNAISYAYVRENYGANGENGYKDYKYSVQLSPTSESSRTDMSNYTAQGSVNGIVGLYGNGSFNQLPQTLTYYAPYSQTLFYPVAPQQVDVRRGHLIGEYVYDASGTMLESTDNIYDEKLHEEYWIRGFKAHRCVDYVGGPPPSGNQYFLDGLTYYKLHTGISRLISTIHKSYRGPITVTQVTTNGYESPNHTLKTTDTTTDSKGNVIINKYYYSFDYANTATGDNTIGKMKARNLLLPVSTYSWKNGKLVGGKITKYEDFAGLSTDTLINPATIYALETVQPLTATQASITTDWTDQQAALVPDTYFQVRANFAFDGVTGKPIAQRVDKGPPVSYLWDYYSTYPIAEAKNADQASIAYTSFDADGTGTWTVASSARDNTTALTGNQSYVLSSGNISRSGLVAANTYVISYWTKNSAPYTISGTISGYPVKGATNKGWTYYEHHVTGVTSVTLTGSGNIDELRLYPLGAQMTTYTYDPAVGITSSADAKSDVTYYEYDGFQRLINLKDKDGNIVKHTDYHYQGQ